MVLVEEGKKAFTDEGEASRPAGGEGRIRTLIEVLGRRRVWNTEIRQHVHHVLTRHPPVIIPVQDLKPFAHLADLCRRQLGQCIATIQDRG